jgi:16S rRNA (uracil1498-N3)-methyltransferase
MPRFFIHQLARVDQLKLDSKDELRHLACVLRLKEGDELELVNGCGDLATAVIVRLTTAFVQLRILSFEHIERAGAPQLLLGCAIPKRSKLEDIIDKAVQLGVDEFFPLITERTEVRPRPQIVERYRKVAVAAVKQSGRLWSPVVHPPQLFPEFIASVSARTGLTMFIPWLGGERVALRQALSEPLRSQAGSLLFLIGPEGDFSPREVSLACTAGALPVSLGDNILRVDTAAIAVSAFTRLLYA